MFVLKDDGDDSAFLGYFDSAFPNHIGPAVKEIALGGVERG